ncbi:MAG: hypothetical protein IJU52_06620 [Clostridia bacterium]|nr:hypothetical protein [Clostridia bacterium]
MGKYRFSPEQPRMLESMRVPFAVYRYVDKRVVTLALSDGFPELFGYSDRARAYYDTDNNLYKAVRPDDVARIEDAAVRFASGVAGYEVIYRTQRERDGGYSSGHFSFSVFPFSPQKRVE